MFVCHWLIGTLIIVYMPEVGRGSLVHFLLATAGTILFSAILYLGVDRQVQRLRMLVKNRSAPAVALAVPNVDSDVVLAQHAAVTGASVAGMEQP
jgi:peptidoglycan/LPS O-acetylase OafA/YrhL